MRLIASLALLVVLSASGCHADDYAMQHWNVVLAHKQELIDTTLEDWVGAIAAHNAGRTDCTQDEASATADYDEAHATRFSRTLSYVWDGVAGRFKPDAAATADLRLAFMGPVLSGTAMVGGRSRSFCRAEAPDRLVVFVTSPPSFGTGDSAEPIRLAQVPPGYGGGPAPTPYASVVPATPRAEIAARIEKAHALMEAAVGTSSGQDANTTTDPCQPAQAMAKSSATGSQASATYYRQETPGSPWAKTSEGDAQVRQVSPPRPDAPVKPASGCAAVEASTTSALWEDEGSTVLTFSRPKPDTSPSDP